MTATMEWTTKGLEYLGSGCTRSVYMLSDTVVRKEGLDRANESEFSFWQRNREMRKEFSIGATKHILRLAKIVGHSDDFLHLDMEYIENILEDADVLHRLGFGMCCRCSFADRWCSGCEYDPADCRYESECILCAILSICFDIGLVDIHSGNVGFDRNTGQFVLIDYAA